MRRNILINCILFLLELPEYEEFDTKSVAEQINTAKECFVLNLDFVKFIEQNDFRRVVSLKIFLIIKMLAKLEIICMH